MRLSPTYFGNPKVITQSLFVTSLNAVKFPSRLLLLFTIESQAFCCIPMLQYPRYNSFPYNSTWQSSIT